MSISISNLINSNAYSQFVDIQDARRAQSRTAFSTLQADRVDLSKLQQVDESFFQKAYENFAKAPVIESSADLVTQRNEMGNQVDESTRYQQANDLAPEYISYLYNKINKVTVDSNGNETKNYVNPYDKEIFNDHTTTYSAKTKNGTIINVSQTASDLGDWGDSFGQAIQITRTNGLQINIELTDDLRINELEDGGLSVYFASSGITKKYSIDGIESILGSEDSLLGTDEDDIIINKYGTQINSGDGDDIIFNFANNAVINAGSGNDKIIIANPEASGIQIDTGDGSDIVAAYSINSSTINLNDDDFLIAARLDNSTITGSGNISIKAEELNKSILSTAQGRANINIGRVLESAVRIDDTNLVTIGSTQDSNILLNSNNYINAFIRNNNRSDINIRALQVDLNSSSFMNSSISIDSIKSNVTISSLSNSTLYTGDGEDNIKFNSVHTSNIYTNGGNDSIIFDRAMSSEIFSGDGNDSIIFDNAMSSKIFSGGGNDTIKYRIAHSSQINSGSGRDSVTSDIRVDKIYNKNLLSLAAKAWDDQVVFDA